MSTIRFEWKYGGNHVLLAGTFNNWRGAPMRHEDGLWIEEFYLDQGVHQFKFVVDGTWRYDREKSIIDDRAGNINNVVSVEAHGQPVTKPGIVKVDPIKKQEPVKKHEQPTKKAELAEKNQAPAKKQEPVKKQESVKKQEQPTKKADLALTEKKQPTKKQQPPVKNQDHQKTAEPPGKQAKQKVLKQEEGEKQLKKEEKDAMHFVSHWEKIQINSVTGKENWWVYVQTPTDDPAKLPMRRRYPPDCVSCGQKVIVEDDVFSRYGVEWQPLCIKCYASGVGVPLVNANQVKPTENPYCHWCHEIEGVKGQTCEQCLEYVDRVSRDFGLGRNEAYTNLYYYMSGLRKQRKL